jgi:glutamate/tyrosine decarboxylase-like PLP-dependent enzyme
MDLTVYLREAVERIWAWEAGWGAFERHPSLAVGDDAMRDAFAAYAERLTGNYPFFHPRYAGQMLKPPHPVAVLGYLAAMLINPNNHALDGGPPTAQMEKEVVRALAAMFHLPDETLGHLTSSGTIANLEALWVARELHPDKAVACSAEAHYTHRRMGQVLGVDVTVLPVDDGGRLRLDALEEHLRAGRLGTVVLTAGTTALGAVDPIEDAVALCRRYGCRIHVDAAYGGFFALHAWEEAGPGLLSDAVRRHYRAIARCDSVVVDPHKHGLQPYGCGCILFRDPSAGRFYKHDSPYTYFTSDELHLGEISLECSRAGAAAGALWLTLQVLPLRAGEGLGPILAACLRAARAWSERLAASGVLRPYRAPELDIVTYFPTPQPLTASALDAASRCLFERAMDDADNPIFLSVLRADSKALQARLPELDLDRPQARILRSVLMRPEHEHRVYALFDQIEAWAREGASVIHRL